MNESKTLADIRRIFWPIEGHENKKFLPMAMMMFFILFNYAMLRSIKDGLVVANIGAEAISFLKTYLVLPSAILMMILYAKLCNIMNPAKVFYTITLGFIAYFSFFTFVIYPYPEFFHPSEETIDNLSSQLPYLKWFFKIAGHWSYATFYVMSEMWGSMMLSLLFWQFANQITKTSEAKRFYSMFGGLGNFGLVIIPFVFALLLKKETRIFEFENELTPVLYVVIAGGFMIILLYSWMQSNVLTDPTLYSPDQSSGKKKKKAKLSIKESFNMIFHSRYLLLIAALVISYGISINLIEGIWKAQIKLSYPGEAEYTNYMGNFQGYQGVACIIFMVIGSNVLQLLSWRTAAMLTPMMILITGSAFLGFTIFKDTITIEVAAFFGTGPMAFALMLGTAQNILSKATKYSLFDSTKEMSYLPLDNEMRTKGKAAVDVIGGRLGKTGGGIIQSTFFILLPSYSFSDALPYFSSIFLVIIVLWLFIVNAFSKDYETAVSKMEKQN